MNAPTLSPNDCRGACHGACPSATGATPYQVCFRAPRGNHRVLRFPCDAAGRVDLDRLGARQLSDYLYARAMVGRIFAPPVVDDRSPEVDGR